MDKKELLLVFQAHAHDTEVRQIISQIVIKAGNDTIEREILEQTDLNALNFQDELTLLSELLNLNNIEDKFLLEAVVDFYFSNVAKAM